MNLLRSLALFVVLFLPAAFVTGYAMDAFVGPRPPPRFGYEVFQYMGRVLPLLAPTIVAVPALHIAYRRWLAALPESRARHLAMTITPIALLATHLALHGVRYWSVPLVVLFAIPGAIYGASFRR